MPVKSGQVNEWTQISYLLEYQKESADENQGAAPVVWMGSLAPSSAGCLQPPVAPLSCSCSWRLYGCPC